MGKINVGGLEFACESLVCGGNVWVEASLEEIVEFGPVDDCELRTVLAYVDI